MKLIKYSAIVLCLLLLIIAALFFYSQSSFHHKHLQNQFISYWAQELGKIKSPDDINNLKIKEKEQIVFREFPDGTWIAGTCQGFVFEGWSALVITDSTHKIFSSRECISGYEVLYNQIYDTRIVTLEDFYKFHHKYNFEVVKNFM